jgi:hypothetical protein
MLNFAFWAFLEVRIHGVLRSSLSLSFLVTVVVTLGRR